MSWHVHVPQAGNGTWRYLRTFDWLFMERCRCRSGIWSGGGVDMMSVGCLVRREGGAGGVRWHGRRFPLPVSYKSCGCVKHAATALVTTGPQTRRHVA